MTSLADLGSISKSTQDGWGLYDSISKLAIPKKAAWAGAGALGAAGTGGLIAQDASRQRKVNASHPYPNTKAGERKRQEHRSGNIASATVGGATGAYLGFAGDQAYQANQLKGTSRKFNQWDAQRKAYDSSPFTGENFRDPKQASRVHGMRARTTSHNANEAKAAEDWLKNHGHPKEPPTKPAWSTTSEGAAFSSHNEKFKRRYGVSMDAPATPHNINSIRRGATKLAGKRGAVIGGVALGGLSLRAARQKAREERMKPKRGKR